MSYGSYIGYIDTMIEHDMIKLFNLLMISIT